MSEAEEFLKVARAARDAATVLAPMPRAPKDAALRAVADALEAATDEIVAANAVDVDRARENGTSEAMIDRLRLDSRPDRRDRGGRPPGRRPARPGR